MLLEEEAGGGRTHGWYGDNYSWKTESKIGGTGGGTSGMDGYGSNGGMGGTQTSAGYCYGKTGYTTLNGAFGKGGSGASYWGGGGGGGLYGGGAGWSGQGGGGGSGYTDGCMEGTTQMTNGVQSGDGYAKITLVSF